MTQDAKTHPLQVLVSYIEKCKIYEAAKMQGRTVSGFARYCMVKEMLTIGGLDKIGICDSHKAKVWKERSNNRRTKKSRETKEEFCARTGVNPASLS